VLRASHIALRTHLERIYKDGVVPKKLAKRRKVAKAQPVEA
jgi:hypothetical protein